MDAISSAARGMQQAMNRMDGHAQRLASLAGGADIDPATEIVGTLEARAAFKANLQALRRADAALGSLLDTWA